jgi:hypothetical protein
MQNDLMRSQRVGTRLLPHRPHIWKTKLKNKAKAEVLFIKTRPKGSGTVET